MAAGRPAAVSGHVRVSAPRLVGLALRLAFGLSYWNGQPLTRDELEYLSLARSLAAGHGFVYDEVMQAGSFDAVRPRAGLSRCSWRSIGAGAAVFTSGAGAS